MAFITGKLIPASGAPARNRREGRGEIEEVMGWSTYSFIIFVDILLGWSIHYSAVDYSRIAQLAFCQAGGVDAIGTPEGKSGTNGKRYQVAKGDH